MTKEKETLKLAYLLWELRKENNITGDAFGDYFMAKIMLTDTAEIIRILEEKGKSSFKYSEKKEKREKNFTEGEILII